MACLDHECHDRECGWTDSSNRTVGECPRCGGPVSSYFDEAPEHDEPEYEEDDDGTSESER